MIKSSSVSEYKKPTTQSFFFFFVSRKSYAVKQVKGALDKYTINLFISNSIEDSKLIQHLNFQLIQPMPFHFMRYSVNSVIFRVSHRLLYCGFIEVVFEK